MVDWIYESWITSVHDMSTEYIKKKMMDAIYEIYGQWKQESVDRMWSKVSLLEEENVCLCMSCKWFKPSFQVYEEKSDYMYIIVEEVCDIYRQG
jgi:hypothetical protein